MAFGKLPSAITDLTRVVPGGDAEATTNAMEQSAKDKNKLKTEAEDLRKKQADQAAALSKKL